MKKQIKHLSYLFFVLIFISSYLEIILRLQYGNPNIPLTEPLTTLFFWPRLIISVMPAIALIIFSSVKKQWADVALILSMGTAIGHTFNTMHNVFHPFTYLITRSDNPLNLFYIISYSAQYIVLILIIILGVIFCFKNNNAIKLSMCGSGS